MRETPVVVMRWLNDVDDGGSLVDWWCDCEQWVCREEAWRAHGGTLWMPKSDWALIGEALMSLSSRCDDGGDTD
jgi:hypothetical protein